MADFIYSSLFGELTRQTKLRFDAASLRNRQLFDNVIYPGFFRWDVPGIGLDFSEIIGSYNLTVSAATVDPNSKEPVRVPYGLEELNQKVLKHAHTYAYPIQEYRKVLQILDSRMLDDGERKRQLVQLMWGGVTNAVAGVEAALDKIVLGALSNEGIFTFNASNNPEGGVKTSIDYGMPSQNKKGVTVDWVDANVNTVDVLGDIQAMHNEAFNSTVLSEIWLSSEKLLFVLKAAKLKLSIFGNDRQNTPLTLVELNDFMAKNGMPVFRVIRRKMMIQEQDGRLTPHTPWNGKNVVFVPAGELGVIKNAYTDSELRPEPTVSYSNYGRIRVSQWGVGEAQNTNGVEFVKAEALALPVITAIKGIYSLKTEP
ncbi:MAG: major capsid protein E [Tannerella sp.]|jgi:hypothetical protein|nr:major capsid protein E [Tannerella sp.]